MNSIEMRFAPRHAVSGAEIRDGDCRPSSCRNLLRNLAFAFLYKGPAAGHSYIGIHEQVVEVPMGLAGLQFRQTPVPCNTLIHTAARASDIDVTPGREKGTSQAPHVQRQSMSHIQIEEVGSIPTLLFNPRAQGPFPIISEAWEREFPCARPAV